MVYKRSTAIGLCIRVCIRQEPTQLVRVCVVGSSLRAGYRYIGLVCMDCMEVSLGFTVSIGFTVH